MCAGPTYHRRVVRRQNACVRVSYACGDTAWVRRSVRRRAHCPARRATGCRVHADGCAITPPSASRTPRETSSHLERRSRWVAAAATSLQGAPARATPRRISTVRARAAERSTRRHKVTRRNSARPPRPPNTHPAPHHPHIPGRPTREPCPLDTSFCGAASWVCVRITRCLVSALACIASCTGTVGPCCHLLRADMEACVYDLVCSNRESFWALRAGQDWACVLSWTGFQQLRDWMLRRTD
jgi:hypothetical protein